MKDETIILEKPEHIQAFAFLQLYYKLKLVYEKPNGPRWRVSPLPIAHRILAENDIHVPKTYKAVFPAYHNLLIDGGILLNKERM